MKKDKDWAWTNDQKKAFAKLKELFTTEPLLVYPDPDRKFKVEADSSGYASGAVLSMLCEDNLWRPCAYISKGFNDTKRNYDVHD